MPQVIYSEAARRDMVRLRDFLKSKDAESAQRIGRTIAAALKILEQYPESGRPVEGMSPEYREWPINFGDSGYVALYRFDENRQQAVVLAIRHQKEAGF